MGARTQDTGGNGLENRDYANSEELREQALDLLKKDWEESVTLVPSDLAREILTEKRMEILEALKEEEIGSMRALSRELERDPSAVKRDLDLLWKHSLIDYEEEGNRKKPVRSTDKILIEPF